MTFWFGYCSVYVNNRPHRHSFSVIIRLPKKWLQFFYWLRKFLSNPNNWILSVALPLSLFGSATWWRCADEDKCYESLPFQRCCPIRPVGSYFSLTIVWWCDFVSLCYRYIPNVSHHPSSSSPSSASPYSSLSLTLSFLVAKDIQGHTSWLSTLTVSIA